MPGKLEEAVPEVGGNKVRQGRWVAEQSSSPPDVDLLYGSILSALRDRGMPVAGLAEGTL